MSGVLRSLPDFAPTDVTTTIGIPRNVSASVPPDASKRSACSRAQSDVLGSYSPVRGISDLSTCGRIRQVSPRATIMRRVPVDYRRSTIHAVDVAVSVPAFLTAGEARGKISGSLGR